MEVEFYRSLPTDITVHTSHIYRASTAVDAQAMAETGSNAAQTALSLSQTQLALIVYGHTASSYVSGPPGDADIARMVGEAVGVPAITTAMAAVRCLRSVGAKRIWLAAPYPDRADPVRRRLPDRAWIRGPLDGMFGCRAWA